MSQVQTEDTATDVRDYEVVIVAYRSRELVQAILDRLPPQIPVAVVDNAQGADGLDVAAAERPGTRYLTGPGTGYPAAANLGVATSTRSTIIFVNPDSLPTVELLDALAAEFEDDPDLAVNCAIQVDEDGHSELGVGGWEPSVTRAVVHAVGLHKLFPRAGLWAQPRPHEEIDVDWLGGACLAVRREHFQALGGLDESYFVYNDDVEFGRSVRAAGLRSHLRTDLLVPVAAVGSGDSRHRMLRQRGDSMIRYLRRHHPWARVQGIRAALTAGTAARAVVARLRGDRVQTEEHTAYIVGLWAGPPAR